MSVEAIAGIAAGIVAVVGAITGGAVAIIRALHTHEGMENKKLDHITFLVDGRFGKILVELAQLREQWARHTQHPEDEAAAEKARAAADAHLAGETEPASRG